MNGPFDARRNKGWDVSWRIYLQEDVSRRKTNALRSTRELVRTLGIRAVALGIALLWAWHKSFNLQPRRPGRHPR